VDFHQFYLGCLAHASYLIGSEGEAAVVDPQRDVDEYIAEAKTRGLTIKYIIETHLHADFVSGHRELADRTGAQIVISRDANAEFPHKAVRDGEILRVGSIELRAVATPGHTPEGISWLVVESGQPKKVLTGDTLFIGDVGRPDLAGGRGFTPQAMAAMLYDSIHSKLLILPDNVEVWPAHGAGSACGKNISRERSSTIGVQRRTNYALQPMSRDAFVNLMTADLPEAPRYFPMDAELNRQGARSLSEVTAPPINSSAVVALIASGATVLDVRPANAFGSGHIPGAVNIGLEGQFASWCGTLLPRETPIVVSAQDDARASEAIMRLARVGLENAVGYIRMTDWDRSRNRIDQITVDQLRDSKLPVLDVRRTPEYESGRVPGAQHIPLQELPDRMHEVADQPTAVICASGYRSSMAASLLARAGRKGLANVAGGTSAWVRAGFEVEKS
jgi:glyoxylase-like metal-dependent hydrolase (beta-lactamase superfamily II)/rhodanese-related sulfurtransferase